MCAHAGQAQPTAPSPRVLVAGQPIVTQPAPYVIAGCPFVLALVPSPCLTAQWITASTRVTSGGLPVLLQDSQALCVPNGTPLTIVVTQQQVMGG